MVIESNMCGYSGTHLVITYYSSPPPILIVNEQAQKSRPSSLAKSSDPLRVRIYMIPLGNLSKPLEIPSKTGQNLKWTFRTSYINHQFVLKTSCIGKAYSSIHYPSHYENLPTKDSHWSAKIATPQTYMNHVYLSSPMGELSWLLDSIVQISLQSSC